MSERTRVTYIRDADEVLIQTFEHRSTNRGPKRRYARLVATLAIPRKRLRKLADQLHDLGDWIDREERESAIRPTDGPKQPVRPPVPAPPRSTVHDTTVHASEREPHSGGRASGSRRPDGQTGAPAVDPLSPAKIHTPQPSGGAR